eukprot:Nk52_evm74s208 gene=Nk52_evmTU74s208
MQTLFAAHFNFQGLLGCGDRVAVPRYGQGTVKWVGFVDSEYQPTCRFAGVQLDNPHPTRHNGRYKGKQYFNCPDHHGLFVPEDRCKIIHKFKFRRCNYHAIQEPGRVFETEKVTEDGKKVTTYVDAPVTDKRPKNMRFRQHQWEEKLKRWQEKKPLLAPGKRALPPVEVDCFGFPKDRPAIKVVNGKEIVHRYPGYRTKPIECLTNSEKHHRLLMEIKKNLRDKKQKDLHHFHFSQISETDLVQASSIDDAADAEYAKQSHNRHLQRTKARAKDQKAKGQGFGEVTKTIDCLAKASLFMKLSKPNPRDAKTVFDTIKVLQDEVTILEKTRPAKAAGPGPKKSMLMHKKLSHLPRKISQRAPLPIKTE